MIQSKPLDDNPSRTIRRLAALSLGAILACGLAALAFFVIANYMAAHHFNKIAFLIGAVIYCAVILGITIGATVVGRRMSSTKLSAPAKRYSHRFLTAMIVYVLTLVVCVWFFASFHPAGPIVWLLALAPAIPLLACIVVMALYMKEETDEFQRAIFARSGLWATGGILAVATVWGFLEQFHLVPHAPSWIVFPLWAVFFGLAQAYERLRYQ